MHTMLIQVRTENGFVIVGENVVYFSENVVYFSKNVTKEPGNNYRHPTSNELRMRRRVYNNFQTDEISTSKVSI
jgi:hypothetical protein